MPANATTSAVRPANALMQPRIDGTMQATPRNALLGYIADALNAANNYANKPNPAMPMGKANPPLSLLANALGIGDLGATADNLSYGRNLTQGQGMARQMLPETQNALLTAGPLAAKFPKQAAAVTAGLLSGGGDMAAARAAIDIGALQKQFPTVDFHLQQSGDKANLFKVVVPPEQRGAGVGSDFMSALVKAADEDGARLGLSPSADFGGNKARLVDFYRRFGFVPNKGRNADYEFMQSMVRSPTE